MAQKPELVMLETPGFHNKDLEVGRNRMLKNGSWKKQRIIMIIPAGQYISTKVYLSHSSIAFPPNNGVVRIAACGMEVGEAYDNALNSILADPNLSQFEYIFTVEHDNLIGPDCVINLLEKMENHPEFAAISSLYWTKGMSGCPQIWGDPKDPVLNFRPQPPDVNGGLVECNGIGMGAALWRLSMFKDAGLRRPFFKTQTKGGISTQDLYFCGNAKSRGFRFAVDCSSKVGHWDEEGSFGIEQMAW